MELIDRLKAKRDRVQRSLESQQRWREDLLSRLDATDERIGKHRAEVRHLDQLIEALDVSDSA